MQITPDLYQQLLYVGKKHFTALIFLLFNSFLPAVFGIDETHSDSLFIQSDKTEQTSPNSSPTVYNALRDLRKLKELQELPELKNPKPLPKLKKLKQLEKLK